MKTDGQDGADGAGQAGIAKPMGSAGKATGQGGAPLGLGRGAAASGASAPAAADAAHLQHVSRLRAVGGWMVEKGMERPMLWASALVVIVFFVWAANAPLEEVTRGVGKVAPLNRGQIIQSLEGGIVHQITVEEGEEVAPGQVLAELDDTRFRTAWQDLQGQTIALRAALSRLYAEMDGASAITFEPDVLKYPHVVGIERALFAARRRRFIETSQSLGERIALANNELNLVRPVVRQGAVSAVDEIRLERAAADLKGERAEARNSYFQEINDEIAKKSAELESLKQQMAQKRDALIRTQLRSPVRGIVKDLQVTTRGGVVDPGQTIMEIVPLDDQLYVEAEIRPRDVAFLHPGQSASVKITAYDYTVYGDLKGKLVFISADTLKDETKREAEPYYRVRVLTNSASLRGPDGPLPIKPGMVAEVAIQTGKKTVLEYLLKPLLRGQEAFSER